jgi:hypothetical protein
MFQPTNRLDGQTLPNPTPATTGLFQAYFDNNPLFPAGGPSPNDVAQGDLGDSALRCALMAVAARDPARIRQMIVSLGDGTYAVDLDINGIDYYDRVDTELPVNSAGTPVYAQLGQQGALWVALIEKAWTHSRPAGVSWWFDNVGTYHYIEGGSAGELLSALGQTVTGASTDLFEQAVLDEQAGKIVCLCASAASDPQLVSALWYYVDHLNYSTLYLPSGPVTYVSSITLRSPWGVGYPEVTVTPAQVASCFGSEMSSTIP